MMDMVRENSVNSINYTAKYTFLRYTDRDMTHNIGLRCIIRR